MKVKGINAVFLYVSNVERSRKFYEKHLNLGKPSVDTPYWVEWKLGKGSSNLALAKASDAVLDGCVPARSTIRFSMVVDNVRKSFNELFEKGVQVLSEPQNGGGFLYVDFLDPDGNVLRLLEWSKRGS